MAYIKNPTNEQRQEWRAQKQLLESQMKEIVENLALSWKENPETIAEALSFGSRMYRYSVRNNMLIYAQNPHATYVQSYKAWKQMGASIKAGEKGYKIRVKIQRTMLQIGKDMIPLSRATEEQKAQYHAGEIKGITSTDYGIGTVFDISQTTYPTEQYPRLFSMGYESELHASLVKGLTQYSQNVLHCPVTISDMESISLRGEYRPDTHAIRLNKLLEDTQRLSTLSHEIGHAIQHQETNTKSKAQIELEGDALGIMIESHFGIEPTETRRRHLADNYWAYEKLYQENEGLESFGQVLSNVFDAFKKELPAIMEYVDKELPLKPLEKGVRQHVMHEKENIYDRIKQEVHILDYAPQHGIQLRRVGRYYTMAEHDSVRIDPEKNCFWRNSGIGQTTQGSVIDFAAAFVHGDNLHEALRELTELVGGKVRQQRTERQSVVQARENEKLSLSEKLPKHGKNMHRAYAYLTQTRYIDQDIVQDFVNRKMLYQDMKGNCVFVSYDKEGKPVFANFRGTLSDVKFLGDVPGSDYQHGFYINNSAQKIIVTESVIDAMSVMTILQAQGIDYNNYDYLPLNGTDKHEALIQHLQQNPKEEVLLALDHDTAGVKNMQLIHDRLKNELNMSEQQITYHIPGNKDWNMDLTQKARKFQTLNDIPFLVATELPQIHQCAIQSTQYVEETGFRNRNGKDQYRFVELAGDGTLQPVDIGVNTIFLTKENLQKKLPNMYEEISYEEILKKQAEMQREQNQVLNTEVEKQHTIPERTTEIKGYRVAEGMLMAKVLHDGVETEEAIWQEQGRLYVAIGYEVDDSYEEHDLTETERQLLEQYVEANKLELDDISPILLLKEASQFMEKEKSKQSFLDQLQQQNFEMSEQMLQEPEPIIGG